MKRSMTSRRTNLMNYATYLLVIAFFAVITVMNSSGNLSSIMKGMLVPICAYSVMAVSLNLTVVPAS